MAQGPFDSLCLPFLLAILELFVDFKLFVLKIYDLIKNIHCSWRVRTPLCVM